MILNSMYYLSRNTSGCSYCFTSIVSLIRARINGIVPSRVCALSATVFLLLALFGEKKPTKDPLNKTIGAGQVIRILGELKATESHKNLLLLNKVYSVHLAAAHMMNSLTGCIINVDIIN